MAITKRREQAAPQPMYRVKIRTADACIDCLVPQPNAYDAIRTVVNRYGLTVADTRDISAARET